MEGPTSLISRIHNIFSDGIHFAAPISSLQTNEVDLVRGILQIIQGNSSSFFGWDEIRQRFYTKAGIYVTHLSQSSLHGVLSQFLYAASCLRLVQDVVSKVEISVRSSPTLRAFASSASAWLKRLRDIALKEEVKISESDRAIPTLLGLASTLSSLCSGAEYLLQIVNEAVPQAWIESIYSIPAAEVAVHILDLLYKKINEVCLVRGGEEEAYQMLLYLFVGSLLPLIESIDSWLYEGILDDPFEEMYFYENKVVSISDAEFWEKSYLVRSCSYQKLGSEIMGVAHEHQACPFFVKDIAKAIISAGKSLQLIRHVPMTLESTAYTAGGHSWIDGFESSSDAAAIGELHRGLSSARLTLSEVFCVSLSGLLDHGDRVYNYIWQDNYPPFVEAKTEGLRLQERDADRSPALIHKGKIWFEFLNETLRKRGYAYKDTRSSSHLEDDNAVLDLTNKQQITKSYWPENPVITVCHELLNENTNAWTSLNLSRNYHLPPLNDEDLREAIFGPKTGITLSARGTDYSFGFQFNKSEYLRCEDDNKFMEQLFPFPTILPTFQDNLRMSELLPFQRNSTLSSRILSWIEVAEPKGTPLPMVIVQECLNVYIKKQVDYIGSHMLSKLLNEWRLMDELGVLRAIYLLGSGDLLQHFLAVLFNKLDEGKSWDDDFELNMILQESITNSADGMLLSAPDSLVVSIVKPSALDGSDQQIPSSLIATPRIGHEPGLGISGLDVLNFTYKVSWPLELIANSEAIKKYNQVMRFLIKVKRAKFVLDKARRWIWKGKGTVTVNCKHRWLVEQKLMHFVDAFHNYVMDRVYHSAWRELCKGMAAARSLDEVIEVHDTYLLTIQRQCFVVPDKLWALIASRINSILGLALDFYSIQKTLNSSGTVSAIKARCEMEVDRIEKQFDDCIAFLLRVLSFKLNVGHFPHLADLVTRINYNYYYMSDNGNMITAPGSDTIKLGKPFPSRSG